MLRQKKAREAWNHVKRGRNTLSQSVLRLSQTRQSVFGGRAPETWGTRGHREAMSNAPPEGDEWYEPRVRPTPPTTFALSIQKLSRH